MDVLADSNTEEHLNQLLPLIKKSVKDKALGSFVLEMERSFDSAEQELESVSLNNAEDIILSLESINKFQTRATAIQSQVLDISSNLRQTGDKLTNLKKTCVKYKKIHNKISETIFVLKSCLQLLEKTNQVVELTTNDNHFLALKTLDDLSSLSLNDVDSFQFVEAITKSVPEFRTKIKDDCLNAFKKWLFLLEQQWVHIGASASSTFESISTRWLECQIEDQALRNFNVNSSVEVSLRQERLNPFQFDMSPAFNALLVFQTLADTSALSEEALVEWKRKSDRLVYTTNRSLERTSFALFEKTLHEYAGFLISEIVIGQKTHNQIDLSVRDVHLTQAVTDLALHSVKQLGDSEESFIRLRSCIGSLVMIMDHYRFDSDLLYSAQLLVFEDYSNLLVSQFDLTLLFQQDDSMSMTVTDPKTFGSIVSSVWYIPREIQNEFEKNKTVYPKVLAFSLVYPQACQEIRRCIKKHFKFWSQYFKIERRFDPVVKVFAKNIDRTLLKIVSVLKPKLNTTNKEEITTNLINLEFFTNSVKEIEKYLEETVPGHPKLVLGSYHEFYSLKKLAEDKLFDMVDSKVEDLMDFASWDWSTDLFYKEPQFFVRDIGDFLEMLFSTTLVNLTTSLKKLLLFRTFDLLANYFMRFLYEDATCISEAGLTNFDNDVTYIESIINSLNGSADHSDSDDTDKNVSLQSMFYELRQSINLLKAGSLDEFKDAKFRMRHFDRIKPEKALLLIEKLSAVQALRDEATSTPDLEFSPGPENVFARFGHKFKNGH